MKRMLKYFKFYKKETILAPLFKLLEALLELLIPILVAKIIDDGIANGDKVLIIRMVIIMIACGIVGLAFSILGQYFSAKCAVGYVTVLRHDLFNHLEHLRFSDIDNLGTSSMITRMTSDVNQVQTGINLTLRLFLRSPFVVFGAAIMGTILAPQISYVFWIAIPVLSVVIFGIMLITMPMHKNVQENLDEVVKQTRENLTGVRVLRAFTQEKEEINTYGIKIRKLEKSQNKVGNISNIMNPLTYIIINIAIIALIYVGGIKVNSGLLKQGEVIALYNYMSQILVELIKLANLIITMTKSIACSKRIAKIFDINTNVEIVESTKNEQLPYICYDHVSLCYNNASCDSLSDITLNIEKGETIGIIGGTGSGKSSLVNLLPRFYDATGGCLYLDGKDIKSYTPTELREKIGIVLQKAVLFKGTIKENLEWGRNNPTDEELEEACRVSQALNVVSKKENGMDSIVEQNGRNFSGGERQRLSIARALIKKPEILILDDSSSALDYQTDALLRKAIKELDYKPTVLIVSQRTTSIQNASKIAVLDDGKLVGFDTHDNLLKNCLVYQEIYYSQFKNGGK